MHDLALGCRSADVGIQKVPIIRGHERMASMDAPVAITMPNDGKGTIDTCEWCKTKDIHCKLRTT